MINPVPEYLNCTMLPLVGHTMLELGNKKTGQNTYKDYFTSIGFEHISIDWNGLDGALKLDLRQPLDLGTFDMVTNLGTTEHVSNQSGVWKNIHNFVAVGGVFVNLTPMEGDWWWHGEYYPRFEFFEEFAKNGYRIDYMAIGREHPHRNIDVRMTKLEHKPFIMPPENTIYYNHRRPR